MSTGQEKVIRSLQYGDCIRVDRSTHAVGFVECLICMRGDFVVHGSNTDGVWMTDSHPVRYDGSGDWFAWSEALVPATCSSIHATIVYNVLLRIRPE